MDTIPYGTNASTKIIKRVLHWSNWYKDMVTNLDHTYQHSPNHHNSGKMAIDLTVSRRINNLTVKTKEMENINTLPAFHLILLVHSLHPMAGPQ